MVPFQKFKILEISTSQMVLCNNWRFGVLFGLRVLHKFKAHDDKFCIAMAEIVMNRCVL